MFKRSVLGIRCKHLLSDHCFVNIVYLPRSTATNFIVKDIVKTIGRSNIAGSRVIILIMLVLLT